MIKVKQLHKYYNDLHVLKGVSFEVKQNELVVLVGSSGSGKSTLLRCLSHLERVDSGEVWIEGVKQTKVHDKIGMIYEHFNLFPSKTVLENIINRTATVYSEVKQREIEHGMEILEKVGLEDKAYVYPISLSKGQKQRVVIARVLAKEPKIILFDEPTSNLDCKSVEKVLNIIKRLAREGMTIVVAVDEINKFQFGDRFLYLEDGVIVREKHFCNK